MMHKKNAGGLFSRFGGLVTALVESWYFFLKLAEFYEFIEAIEDEKILHNQLILKVKPCVSRFSINRGDIVSNPLAPTS